MRWEWDLDPHGPARLAGPLVGFIGRRQELETWRRLKRLLEQEPSLEPNALS
jgi:hypothetical protein